MLKECLLAAALVSLASAHHTPHPLGDIGEWIDMTYDFGADTVHHPKFGDFQLTNDLKTFLAAGDDKFWVEANTVCSPEHLGTHIDAPKHFAKEGWTVSKIPLSHLVAPGVKIDVSKEANENANYSLTKERIMEWEQEHGRIPLNSIVFMYFNWERFWPSTSDMYKTTDLTNTSTYVFPGLHPDAAEWLIKDRSIVAVGTDAPSIDAGQERQNLRSHVTLYENSVYGLEFVANLSRVPEAHFDVFVGPVKFEEGTGGPVRIAAFVLKDDVDMGHIHHPKHKADKIVVSYASKNVGDWVDLTYDMNSNIPRWPTAKALNYTEVNVGNTSSGAYMELRSFCVGEHVGTHIDAARHFSKNGQTVNEIPLDHLLGIPGVKIDLKEKASKDVNALLTVEDLQEWEKRNGQIPQGSVVFLEVGWSDKWSSPEEFFGTKVPEDPDTFNFPGFGDKAVEWLVRERQVVGFGTETASLDAGSSHNFLAHRAMLDEHQLFGLENLANLDQIPEKDFTVFIMPYKIRGGSGGPTRVYVVKEAAYKPAIETALSSADEEPTSQEEPSSEPEPASGGPVKGAFFPMVAAAGFLAFLLQQ